MFRRQFLILTGCVLLGMSACVERPEPATSGYLYFGAGPYLGVLNLGTGDAWPAAKLGDLNIWRVSTLDNDELLLSVSDNQPGRADQRILRFAPADNHSSNLLLGRAAQYLPINRSIVYDTGTQLVAVPRRNVRSSATVIHAHARNDVVSVLALSDADILFAPKEEGALIRRFNLESGASEVLDRLSGECVLDGALWMADRSCLLCKESRPANAQRRYRWVSLEGRVESELVLPGNGEFRAVAYLQDQGVVVLNESRRGWFNDRDQHPVWVYNTGTGDWHRIAKNQYLDKSVVYRRLVQ